MPAEWEHQDAVWFGWEDESIQYYPVIVNAIKILMPYVQVKVAVKSDSLLLVAKNFLYKNQIDTSSIKFYTIPGDRYWIRDYGAAFLVNERGELGVADFEWDRCGYPEWLKYKYDGNPDSIQKYWNLKLPSVALTAKVDSLMASVEGSSILKTNIIQEGGAIEVNGKGCLILCEGTVLNRNSGKSREEIEKEFKRVLGVTKIIWLKQGLAEDPLSKGARFITGKYFSAWGTGGHTDEFVRFASPNTVMLAWVNEEERNKNPLNEINYQRMNENFRILQKSTDQDGKPFNIIKVPLPDLIVKPVLAKEKIDGTTQTLDIEISAFKKSEVPRPGDTLLRVAASSYMNYVIANGIVILPTYVENGSSKEKEQRVKDIFQQQFPNRRIVFINETPLNWEGGGLHCSTQQQPSTKK
jgi:agmatine deiminase